MKASFSPEYAAHLGHLDGLEYGTRHPHRDFQRNATDDRSKAYFAALDTATKTAQRIGLDMRCLVHWDNPGFDTPRCECPSEYIGFAYGHVIPLCGRHAKVQANSKDWAIVPKDWL